VVAVSRNAALAPYTSTASRCVRACYRSVLLRDRAVTTIGGTGTTDGAKVEKAWLDLEVIRCGYCQSGQWPRPLCSQPLDLARGLFAKARSLSGCDAVFFSIPGDMLDDSVSTPRALAIKAIGVEGKRLEGSEGDVTQDFVLNNGPAFGAFQSKKTSFKDRKEPFRCRT
jgi:hypothetical protein